MPSSGAVAEATAHFIDREIRKLQEFMIRLGTRNADGAVEVTFGVLFDDPASQQTFEALAGTLKAAKKRGVVDYAAPILLKGAHDKVVIVLRKEPTDDAA